MALKTDEVTKEEGREWLAKIRADTISLQRVSDDLAARLEAKKS